MIVEMELLQRTITHSMAILLGYGTPPSDDYENWSCSLSPTVWLSSLEWFWNSSQRIKVIVPERSAVRFTRIMAMVLLGILWRLSSSIELLGLFCGNVLG